MNFFLSFRSDRFNQIKCDKKKIRLTVLIEFCLFQMMLYISQQFFSHVGTISCRPGLNKYLAEN